MLRRLSVKFMAGITATLVLMLSANLWMVWRQQQRDLAHEMHGKAQVVTRLFISTRLFIARSQDKINRSSTGHMEFKGLNPAAVGREVGTIYYGLTGYTIKQTRPTVRRAENEPDEFDRAALAAFAADPALTEFFRQVDHQGKAVFRYAVPLYMERECLACHGEPAGELDIAGFPKEGYQEGDLGGAITVGLPMAQAVARIRRNAVIQVWVIAAVALASLLVIYLLSRRLVTAPMEKLAAVAARIGSGNLVMKPAELRLLHDSLELGIVADNMETMARNLRELYDGLEAKVAERTRELEQANQLQSQFLATVSHELRTPLTSIIAFTELLLKQAEGREQEYLEDVLESSRRLLEMVNNLLDLSRLKAGRMELFTDIVELQEVVTPVERALRPLAEQKGIRLITEVTGLPLLLIDPQRIQQVLINLVGNAIKFTPDGGEIRIRGTLQDGWVEVAVQDTGPGIAREHAAAIFEAFRRVEWRDRQQPGSGLGLALARNLVELHGGRIWVEEASGGGSVFRFTIPTAPPTAAAGGE